MADGGLDALGAPLVFPGPSSSRVSGRTVLAIALASNRGLLRCCTEHSSRRTEAMNFSDWIQFIAAAATMILLVLAAVSDITRYRIPNAIVYAIVAAFAVGAIFNFTWPAIVWPVLAGVAMFLLGAGLFALGLFGGGDVKLIAAMALWTGFADLPRFLLIMGAAGGLLGLVLLLKRRRRQPATAGTAPAEPAAAEAVAAAAPTSEATLEAPRPTRKSHIPYGVGIAVAGLDFFLISQHSPFAPYWPWMQ
jgi:prepilin peptidase CpaA